MQSEVSKWNRKTRTDYKLDCEKHNKKKNYLFCLEDGCNNRLTCQLCHEHDKIHSNHNFILIEPLMNANCQP